MVGAKRSIKNVTDNEEENLSVPPGFVSLTSLTLKKIVTDLNSATERDRGPGLVGVPLRNSDLESFKMSLLQRPWISHGQFERVRHQDDSAQIGNNLVVLYSLQCNYRRTYYKIPKHAVKHILKFLFLDL